MIALLYVFNTASPTDSHTELEGVRKGSQPVLDTVKGVKSGGHMSTGLLREDPEEEKNQLSFRFF